MSNGLVEYFCDLPDPRVRGRTDYLFSSPNTLGLINSLIRLKKKLIRNPQYLTKVLQWSILNS